MGWTGEREADDLRRDEEVEMERQRVHFCHQYEGYGALCDCQHPAPLTYPELEVYSVILLL